MYRNSMYRNAKTNRNSMYRNAKTNQNSMYKNAKTNRNFRSEMSQITYFSG